VSDLSESIYYYPFGIVSLPRYFKDILANKYEIATLGVDHVKMSEECSAAIANGLEKQKDPGCPTIPCSVDSFKFEKALCDLGASVSVMPRDVFEKLRLPLEPTSMCLELGDNSIRYPLGIAEDVPVKVGHHFIPVDFVVLEMGEREKPSLILGRPFLKIVGATIDVGKGEIMFDINGERSSFTFRPRLEACNMIEVKNAERTLMSPRGGVNRRDNQFKLFSPKHLS
jgi:predicted aspartyl protease